MRAHRHLFAWMLAASAALHALGILAAERWLKPPAPYQALPVLEARIEIAAARDPEAPAPAPRLLKNTMEATPKRPPTATRPPRTASGAASVALARAEPMPEAHLGETLKRLSDTLLYPPQAVQQGLEGEVVVLLELGEGGRVLDVSIASGSGHAILDDAALRAALRLGSLSPALAGKAILLPVRFRLL